MEFGFGVPTRGPQASPEALATLAQRGEALGYDIVSVSDHIVIPRRIASQYPYSESGTFGGGGDGACLEQLTLLAFLAGQTSRLRLLTSVMVVPHRSAVLAAKVLASIDVLSGGRVIVGCGVGWMREEFEAIGAPPYDHRGTVSDEYIQAFRELWTKDAPAFAGEYVSFSDISFAPKPVQSSGPPIWVGGESPAALRRAGRLGDAWYPIGSNPTYPLVDGHRSWRTRSRGCAATRRRRAEIRRLWTSLTAPAGTMTERPARSPTAVASPSRVSRSRSRRTFAPSRRWAFVT